MGRAAVPLEGVMVIPEEMMAAAQAIQTRPRVPSPPETPRPRPHRASRPRAR